MNPTVLVVDDQESFAEIVVEEIRNSLGLPAEYATSGRGALEIVKAKNVAVVVLDQRLNGELGTDIFKELRAIDPGLRVIMLTGEADASEVGLALRLKFADYLSKDRIKELSEKVIEQYAGYIFALREHVDRESLESPIRISRRKAFSVRNRVEIRIVGSTVTGEGVVEEADWTTVLQLNIGQSNKLTYQRNMSEVLVVEDSVKSELRSALKISSAELPGLLSSLDAKLSASHKNSSTVSSSTSVVHESRVTLASDPSAGSNVTYVRSRLFQQAPVFRTLRVILEIKCRCCGVSQVVPMRVKQFSGHFSTRQVDHMSDESVNFHETGFIPSGDQSR
jgi:CheY-like chemotaxis protein